MLELAFDKVERVAIGADFGIEVDNPRLGQRNARNQFDAGYASLRKMPAIERRRGLVVAARRNEVEYSVAVHRSHAFERRRIHAADFALELKRQIIHALGPVQIGVYLR